MAIERSPSHRHSIGTQSALVAFLARHQCIIVRNLILFDVDYHFPIIIFQFPSLPRRLSHVALA